MQKLELILSPEADDNLAIIYNHSFDSWGKKRADSYLDELEKSFDMLCKSPNIGQQHPDISIIYRIFPVNKHWIIYNTQKSQLIIIAIIHMSMDVEKRLEKFIKNIEK
ncbi:MAG: type II toxin-antitoxin system RelE/ParE family toxin [Rickettsiales bacterium]